MSTSERLRQVQEQPDMSQDVDAAFNTEHHQAQEEWNAYLAYRREKHGVIDENGRVQNARGTFEAAKANNEYQNHIYDTSLPSTSRADLGLVSLADAARDANDRGDKTTFINIQDEIQDRLIALAKQKSWTSEHTDKMLTRLINRMHAPAAAAETAPDASFGIADNQAEQPEAEATTVEERPRVQYWSAGAITSTDPNRTPYSPTPQPYSEKLRQIDWQWGMPATATNAGPAPELNLPSREKVVNKRQESRRRRFGAAAVGIATLVAAFQPSGSSAHNANVDVHNLEGSRGVAPIEEAIGAMPSASTSEAGFEIAPLITPKTIEAREPAAPADTEAASPPIRPLVPAAAPSGETVVKIVDESDIQGEIIEPQGPRKSVASKTALIESDNGAVEQGDGAEATMADELNQNEIESKANTIESLTVSVEVAPGDGVTQVLAKVLAQAGYTDVPPDQLFEIYEELVTDPNIGPNAIFEGITLEYNQAAGEYWIQGEGGTEAHLTQAAAEWIQNTILNQQ